VKPIASGRASDILDLGDGRVLRRFKAGGDAEREALVMDHARAHGYPVPRVDEVRADGLVLERVDGRTMSQELRRRPWLLGRHAQLLARLHRALHELPAPAGLPAIDGGDRLLHLDLHPDNIMLSRAGPVVIDWTNARAGKPMADVAQTWVVLATSGGAGGRLFLRWFLPLFDNRELVGALPEAAERRIADLNVTDDERRAVRRLVARHAGAGRSGSAGATGG
jgi:Ser/Thr protein kinase RdoA (MazF antagonist)